MEEQKRSPRPFHPLLMAVYPIVALLANNINEVYVDAAYRPALVAALSAAAVFLIASAVLRDSQKGALITTSMLFVFFTYMHVYQGYEPGGPFMSSLWKHRFMLPLAVVLIGGLTYLIVRTKRDLRKMTSILNVVMLVMVVMPAITIVQYEAGRAPSKARPTATPVSASAPGKAQATPANTPDIYYIIFDRYASAPALSSGFNFDNGEFIDSLESKGFFVAGRSRANYGATYLSLSSSLNMRHHDGPKDEKEVEEMLQDYEVWRFLKDRGYDFLHFGSSWPAMSANRFADINFDFTNTRVDSFSQQLIGTTMLAPVLEARMSPEEAARTRILSQFDKLAAKSAVRGPKFVFAHMMIPHTPYLFDKTGRPLTKEEVKKRPEKQNYLQYLTYANGRIERLIDQILANSHEPPIIIVQADEGFRSDVYEERYKGANSLELHFGILNAFHLPGVDAGGIIDDSITPVNTFRTIFNTYFGTDFKMLADDSYIVIKDGKRMIGLKKITRKLNL